MNALILRIVTLVITLFKPNKKKKKINTHFNLFYRGIVINIYIFGNIKVRRYYKYMLVSFNKITQNEFRAEGAVKQDFEGNQLILYNRF